MKRALLILLACVDPHPDLTQHVHDDPRLRMECEFRRLCETELEIEWHGTYWGTWQELDDIQWDWNHTCAKSRPLDHPTWPCDYTICTASCSLHLE